jgi:hypothetical protein
MTASLQRLTWLASAPFRAQHQLVSGRLSRALPGEGQTAACVFPPPFGRRHSLLGHPFPPGVPPLLRSAYRQATGCRPRTMTGFPCFARARRGRVRAPSIPRGQRCLHGHVCVPCPPPAALQRPVPVTPVSRPVPECLSHEASARVHWRSPLPAIPLACGPRTEREPLGFPPGFTPGWTGPSRACRGGDRPQALAWNNAVAISDLLWRIHSSRATSRRNARARCPLSPTTVASATPIVPAQRAPFELTRPNRHLFTRWIQA